ncbi:acetyltransferase [Agrobacterium salinitolerans]|uniref:acetyltransferase n=1 Tax=Agrobacterium salinitolerans TaxID=1183413 RepID=UPI0015741DD0|nr:acetyltransferase [Agrobacterium salinitolerans]NTA39813.1 acetyltransferase [Agrobacterium salinitolerans]
MNVPQLDAASQVIIYGAGGHARELRDELIRCGYIVTAFVDDFNYDRTLEGVDVISFDRALQNHKTAIWFIAIGAPSARCAIAAKLERNDVALGTFISNHAIISPSAIIKQGAQIFSRSVISSNVVVGRSSIVNFGCIISHDVDLDDFVTISPGVNIAGNVKVFHGAFIGVAASIKNGRNDKKILIGRESTVGAGACIIRDVPEKSVVVGIPGRSLESMK